MPYPYTTERLEQDGLCSTSERARPQRRELATNLGEFSFDLESLPIRDSSEQAELVA